MGYTFGFHQLCPGVPIPSFGALYLGLKLHQGQSLSDDTVSRGKRYCPFTILATSATWIAPVLYIILNRGVVTPVVVKAGAARLSRTVALAFRTVRDASRTDDGASHVSSHGRISLAVGITRSPLPLLAEVPSIEEGRQDEQRNVDRREIVGEPIR
jgi:hypothetical protein